MRRRGTTTTRGPGARGRVAAVAGLAGLAVGLAGLGACDGGPDPAPSVTRTPVESPSPEPTPTPTPTPVDPAAVPPERPAAMDTVDTAGAEAVAQYFIELVPYAEATGDASALRTLAHPECIFCASVLEGVEALVAAGQHNIGGLPDISTVTALEVDPGKWWAIELHLIQAPAMTLDATGTVVDEAPDTVTYRMDLAVISEGGRWLVREVSYEVVERVPS